MPRVKRGMMALKKRSKVMKLAKGFRGARRRLYKAAKEAVMHSMAYAYRDRRARKRDFRKLWIARINAAAKTNGLSYSRLINGLKKAGVLINRKMLADLAVSDGMTFQELARIARQQLDAASGE
ncbi:MAG: 50S ribosomal protein L20 [Armatimonadetes bacterium]|nr:50S ribosomal protein L20 [Armatimonadota bacterium]